MAHPGNPLLVHVYIWIPLWKKQCVFTMISMDLIWWNCKLKACQLTNLHRWLQHWRITPVSWNVLIHRWNHPCLRCPRWKMHCTRRCCRLPWCHSVRFFDLEGRGKMGGSGFEKKRVAISRQDILVYLFIYLFPLKVCMILKCYKPEI